MSRHGLLVIGHGSRLPYNKELLSRVAELISEISDEYFIRCCFMEHSEPAISEGLEEMRRADIDLLAVTPLFLAKGVHVLHDIPEIIGLAGGKSAGEFVLADGKIIPMVYADPIGPEPLLAELMLRNTEKAVNRIQ